MMTDVGTSVAQIIAGKMSPPPAEPLRPDDKLADLGIASLDVVEIIFELEERFDIEIPYNANQADTAAFGTVGEVIAAVEGLVAAKKPS